MHTMPRQEKAMYIHLKRHFKRHEICINPPLSLKRRNSYVTFVCSQGAACHSQATSRKLSASCLNECSNAPLLCLRRPNKHYMPFYVSHLNKSIPRCKPHRAVRWRGGATDRPSRQIDGICSSITRHNFGLMIPSIMVESP